MISNHKKQTDKKSSRASLRMVYMLFLLSIGAMTFISCDSNPTLVDENREFANATWNRFSPETYEIDVKNIDDYYRIDFEIVVDSALMRNVQLPLTVNLYSPNGERRMFYAYIKLVENGRWKGQCTPGRDRNGIRTFTQNIRPFFTFNTQGTYRMEIGQATSQYDLEGIRSFRLLVQRTEIDFKGLKD